MEPRLGVPWSSLRCLLESLPWRADRVPGIECFLYPAAGRYHWPTNGMLPFEEALPALTNPGSMEPVPVLVALDATMECWRDGATS